MIRSLLLLILVSISVSGCAYFTAAATYTVVASVADVAHQKYVDGQWINDYKANLKSTWRAALETLRELNLKVKGDPKLGNTQGVIETEGDGGILIARHPADPANYTRVQIRFSTFEKREEEVVAKKFLDRLSYNLGGAGEV
ncbi:MAG: DUF3568 family protein [Planctomycetota bacterium]|jgi:hypothetical protein